MGEQEQENENFPQKDGYAVGLLRRIIACLSKKYTFVLSRGIRMPETHLWSYSKLTLFRVFAYQLHKDIK